MTDWREVLKLFLAKQQVGWKPDNLEDHIADAKQLAQAVLDTGRLSKEELDEFLKELESLRVTIH
jgi:hypothetical protein